MSDLAQPAIGSAANLQRLLWSECKASGLRQVEIAANAGITEKHLSQVLTGRVVGSLDNADAILVAVGRQLVLGTRALMDRGDRND